ncbi:hypothetical protein EJ071_28210 [Mesorhizobium sp. M1B.F.Ca.ET.045.04.1.1]|nr:hypothetical protein EJ071_28210 [Mesorhizobium sp. M1B.F.Ca.ET.045.04.1.1]
MRLPPLCGEGAGGADGKLLTGGIDRTIRDWPAAGGEGVVLFAGRRSKKGRGPHRGYSRTARLALMITCGLQMGGGP